MHAAHTATSSVESLVTHPSLVPRRRKSATTTTTTEDAMEVLKRASDHIINKTGRDDQYEIFARFVQSELRQIRNKRRLATLQKKIQDLIFDTKMEEIDDTDSDLGMSKSSTPSLTRNSPLTVASQGEPQAFSIQLEGEDVMFLVENTDTANEMDMVV